MSPGSVSLLWSSSVLAEILVFAVLGPALIRGMGPAACLALAAGAGIIRWEAAACTACVAVMVLVEPLHGLNFALAHLTCVTAIGRVAPAGDGRDRPGLLRHRGAGVAGTAATLGFGPLYGWLELRRSGSRRCLAALPLTLRLGTVMR